MKKIMLGVAAFGLMAAGFASAQTMTPAPTVTPLTPTPAPTYTSPSASLVPSESPSSTPTPAVSSVPVPAPTATPFLVTAPSASGNYMQFNDLTVASISGATFPATITATASAEANPCTSFINQNDTVGTQTACPAPITANASGTASSTLGTTGGTYVITIPAGTELILSDRSEAVLANITPGDVINVYGISTGTGTIEARVVRDLSKPAAPGVIPTLPTTPGNTATPGLPTTSVVGTNPTTGQLLQILQTLMIQVQGVIAQLIENSGGTVPSSIGTNTGTGNTSSTTTSPASQPMIPAPTPSASPTP